MSMQSKRPALLLLDWDRTLTTTSTLPLIASIATHPKIHPSLEGLSVAYSADMKHHDDVYVPGKKDRTTLQQEITYLSSLQSVERASIERLEASELFKGVRTGDIDLAAAETFRQGTITLRNGWTDLIDTVQRRGQNGKVAILSVAWSRRFIAHILAEANATTSSNRIAIDDITIKANEISEDGSGRLDRYFQQRGHGIWTAADKAFVMKELVGEMSVSKDTGAGSGLPFVVYIGDSPTDLACLVKADIGICIRDEPMTSEQEALRETLERVGVGCLPIKRYSVGADVADAEVKRIWWAGDLLEVVESGGLNGG